MTTTEIETEIEIAKKTETKTQPQKAVQVDIEALNEIVIAKQQQASNFNTKKFEEIRSEYAEIEQNNTPLDSVQQINNHQTDKQIEILPKRETKTDNRLKKARLKNFIICASIVLCLSVGLIVYNAVQITLTNMQIANIETQISTGSANYENALKQLQKLTSADEMKEQAIDLNMGESSSTIRAELIETRSEIETSTSTNWFNQLCNFLSNMFK